ncbi:unnamed protein product [Dibothriocephalus latus]|uniref:BPTI/Kunitz inhibitor domain-containing protein n=1 Tax=Dibothriocephalus latus TaxID=60516 RepID=A0A3P7LFS2_DIBLA|nr:unnamed protein product [Dibothriocephalus latus]
MTRFAYNSTLVACVEFKYGGCLGNGNNFGTKRQCEKRCARLKHICGLLTDPGPCRANMTRFAYNSTLVACVEFKYGGCLGNGNNFETRWLCEKRCAPDWLTHAYNELEIAEPR